MPAWWRSSCGSPCRDGSVLTKNKNAGLTSSVFSATIYLAFAGVAHLVERDLAKVEVASSSLVARSKKKHHPSGWCFLFGMPRAGLNLLPRPARSALNQEVRQGSCEWLCHSWDAGSEFEPRRPLQKETPSIRMVFSFWNAAGRLELAASTCAQRVKSSAMRAPRAGICS